MVNYPKKKNTYCRKCDKHESHAITWQKKAGKASTTAQGQTTTNADDPTTTNMASDDAK